MKDKNALAKAVGLRTFDTALPNDWVNEVHKLTGKWPQEYGIVWCYDDIDNKHQSWGYPYPLDPSALNLLVMYYILRERALQ